MGRSLRPLLLASTALLLPLAAAAQAPGARPQGGNVVAGQASISQTATRTQVNQSSDRAVIEWRGFDVGANHQVDIRQPGAGSWSLQRVTGPDPSAIAGRVTSNGGVALVNPNGIVFQGGAQVDVAGLIATASDTTNANFMAGRMAFDGQPRPGARVENRGTITVREGGLAALVGPVAANSGTIRARLGRVAIAGGEAFTLDLAGDGLLSFDVTQEVRSAPSGATALATNSGTIEAEGGHVLLTARAASGLLERLVEAGGTVAAAGGTITANAPGGGVAVPAGARLDASAPSGGGRVTV
uniref:two-partner secretion domain-containing protein n=1 Tax=Falsiroseomonas oryzae TaxID=2766473 RepID=UPI0022EA800B